MGKASNSDLRAASRIGVPKEYDGLQSASGGCDCCPSYGKRDKESLPTYSSMRNPILRLLDRNGIDDVNIIVYVLNLTRSEVISLCKDIKISTDKEIIRKLKKDLVVSK